VLQSGHLLLLHRCLMPSTKMAPFIILCAPAWEAGTLLELILFGTMKCKAQPPVVKPFDSITESCSRKHVSHGSIGSGVLLVPWFYWVSGTISGSPGPLVHGSTGPVMHGSTGPVIHGSTRSTGPVVLEFWLFYWASGTWFYWFSWAIGMWFYWDVVHGSGCSTGPAVHGSAGSPGT